MPDKVTVLSVVTAYAWPNYRLQRTGLTALR